MADAAARRDARRKRILENSESRLQRIASRNEFDDSEEKRSKQKRNAAFVETNTVEFSTERFAANKGFIEEEARSVLIEEKAPATFQEDNKNCLSDDFNSSIQLAPNNIHEHGEKPYDKDSTELRHRSVNNERLNSELHAKPAQTPDKCNGEITQNSVASVNSVYSFLASRWILVLLAALVNVMFLFKLEHFFGKAILAPFLVLTLGRLQASRRAKDADSNMLTAALILCNVRPELVYRLKWFTKISSRISTDFAVYIFSFVMMNNLMDHFWYEIGALNSSNEAQVNRYSEEF